MRILLDNSDFLNNLGLMRAFDAVPVIDGFISLFVVFILGTLIGG